MVNDAVTGAREAERRLWLLHVPADARSGLAALLALDDRLGEVVRAAREPMIGQLRLAWWRDALAALDDRQPPAEPLLQALAAAVVPPARGASLAPVADGWEAMLDPPVGDPIALIAAARDRGAALFDAMASLLGGTPPGIAVAGEGWALAGMACALPREPAQATAMLARERLDRALARRWPRRLRPLAMLVALARSDLDGGTPNSPSRAALLWRVRLFGR